MRQKLRPRTRLPNIRLKCHLRLRAASDAPERGGEAKQIVLFAPPAMTATVGHSPGWQFQRPFIVTFVLVPLIVTVSVLPVEASMVTLPPEVLVLFTPATMRVVE